MCRKMIKIKIVEICKCLSLPRQCKYHLFGSSFKEYTIVTNRQKYSTSMRKNFLLGTRRHPASQPVDQAFLVLPWFFGSDLNQEEICKYQIVESSQLQLLHFNLTLYS